MDSLTLAVSRTIGEAALQHAEGRGWAITIAVLDIGGYPMFIARMEDCNFLSPDIARGKAYGALAWKMSSGDLADRFAANVAGVPGMVAASGQRIVPVRGALCIWEGKRLLGAAGASGVRSDEDEECVRAGIEAAGLSSARQA